MINAAIELHRRVTFLCGALGPVTALFEKHHLEPVQPHNSNGTFLCVPIDVCRNFVNIAIAMLSLIRILFVRRTGPSDVFICIDQPLFPVDRTNCNALVKLCHVEQFPPSNMNDALRHPTILLGSYFAELMTIWTCLVDEKTQ